LAKTAPQWFRRAIEILDPLLRVRWSDASGVWVIDRLSVLTIKEVQDLKKREAGLFKAMQPHNIPADARPTLIHDRRQKWMETKDELDSALDRRRIICKPTVLTNEVYNALCMSDIKAYGGYARFADKIEEDEEREARDKQRIEDNKMSAMNHEVFDMLDWLHRKRGSALDNNEQDMRYMLHGKRTQKEDAPLIQLAEF